MLKLFINQALNHLCVKSQIDPVCLCLPPPGPNATQTQGAKKWAGPGGLFWYSTQRLNVEINRSTCTVTATNPSARWKGGLAEPLLRSTLGRTKAQLDELMHLIR